MRIVEKMGYQYQLHTVMELMSSVIKEKLIQSIATYYHAAITTVTIINKCVHYTHTCMDLTEIAGNL